MVLEAVDVEERLSSGAYPVNLIEIAVELREGVVRCAAPPSDAERLRVTCDLQEKTRVLSTGGWNAPEPGVGVAPDRYPGVAAQDIALTLGKREDGTAVYEGVHRVGVAPGQIGNELALSMLGTRPVYVPRVISERVVEACGPGRGPCRRLTGRRAGSDGESG
jgi:hypothetical protein